MSELTDDQLDGLFRKSAEEFDPPFDPAAWQDMKTRLDTHDNPTPAGTPLWKNVLRWGLPVCLLLLLMIGGVYVYRTDVARVDSAPVPTVTVSPEDAGTLSELPKAVTEEPAVVVAQQGKNDSAQTTPNGLSAQSIDDKKQPAVLLGPVSGNTGKEIRTEAVKPSTGLTTGLDKKTAPDATDENSIAYRLKNDRTKADHIDTAPTPTIPSVGERIRVTGTAGNRRSGTTTTERIPVKKQGKINRTSKNKHFLASSDGVFMPTLFSTRAVRNASKPDKIAALNTTETIIQPGNYKEEAAGLPDVTELAIRPARWSKALVFSGRAVEVAAAVQPDTFYQQIAPKLPTERGLSVRLAIAPDLSSVGLNNFTRPGTNVGVLLEYRLAKRWSIQAGLIQSTKIYRAATSEYTVPSGWWKAPMKTPEWVDGRCNMFDIPINIRYDLVVKPRSDGRLPNRWFVGAGVTSYIMKQEDYYYTYPPHTYNQKEEYNVSSGGYSFSNLNMSFGYEHSISRRLSWQVEPFIKAPLRGVGFFKIDLLSTGAFFSIRYKL